MNLFTRYPSPRNAPEKFFWTHLVLAHIVMLVMWELGGREKFASLIAANPFDLNRQFYTGVMHGMRYALIISLAFVGFLMGTVRAFRRWPELFRPRMLVPLILLLSTMLQLLIIYSFPAPLFKDSAMYAEHAMRLAGTGSFIRADGATTVFCPVGYPAILAVFEWITGNMILTARLFNVLCNLLTAILSWKLFRNELSEAGGLLLLTIMALLPSVLFSAVPLMTEPAALTAVITAFYLLMQYPDRWFGAIGAGVCLAAASYMRPVTLLLAVVLLTVMLIRGRYRPQLMAACMTFILLLAPWAVRNAMHFNSFIPVSASGGFNFLMGNHANASGGINFDFVYDHDTENEPHASRDAYARAWSDITDQPMHAVMRLPKKLLHSYKRGDAALIWTLKPGDGKNIAAWQLSSFFVITNIAFYVVVLVSLLTVILKRWGVNSARLAAGGIALFAAVYFSILLFVGSERYIMPLLPLHAFLFARFFSHSALADSGADSSISHED